MGRDKTKRKRRDEATKMIKEKTLKERENGGTGTRKKAT